MGKRTRYPDNQRQQHTQLQSTGGNRVLIPVWEQLATDQTDPWQVVPKHAFTHYGRLLISVAFVFLCRVGCLWVTSVVSVPVKNQSCRDITSKCVENLPDLKYMTPRSCYCYQYFCRRDTRQPLFRVFQWRGSSTKHNQYFDLTLG